VGILLLSPAPCFAQILPVPPPTQESLTAPPVDARQPGPFGRDPVPWPGPAEQTEQVQATTPFPDRVWELLSETPPRGFGRAQTAGFGFGQSAVLAPSYRVTWFPDAAVQGQNTNLSAVRQDFHVVAPVYRDDCQMFGLTTGVRNVLYNTNAVIPNTTQEFPEQLWDVRFGFTYKYVFSNGWSTGADVNFGSASDRPFASIHELTAGVAAFLRIPVGERNAWLFTLMYSPTGELNFPIPGVAFYWEPCDWFNATIGVPLKVMYRPFEDVILEAAYFPLTTVTAKASWHVWGGVFLYTGYLRGNESYFLYDRTDDRDRFFYYDQRVVGGVKMCFGPHCSVDLSSGYAFDRYFFEGHSFNNSNNTRVDVADSPFLSLMLECRF
jgi:hypothetical protein